MFWSIKLCGNIHISSGRFDIYTYYIPLDNVSDPYHIDADPDLVPDLNFYWKLQNAFSLKFKKSFFKSFIRPFFLEPDLISWKLKMNVKFLFIFLKSLKKKKTVLGRYTIPMIWVLLTGFILWGTRIPDPYPAKWYGSKTIPRKNNTTL